MPSLFLYIRPSRLLIAVLIAAGCGVGLVGSFSVARAADVPIATPTVAPGSAFPARPGDCPDTDACRAYCADIPHKAECRAYGYQYPPSGVFGSLVVAAASILGTIANALLRLFT